MKRRDLIRNGLAALGGIAALFTVGKANAPGANFHADTLAQWGSPEVRIYPGTHGDRFNPPTPDIIEHGEHVGVRRIWFNDQLVYEVSDYAHPSGAKRFFKAV